MIHLIAFTGMNAEAKRRAADVVAAELVGRGTAPTIIDNGETAARLPYPTLRIPTGCVCCGAAFGLYHAVGELEREAAESDSGDQYAILITAASAMPEALRAIFGGLRNTRVTTRTIGMAENWMRDRMPYVLEQLAFHADAVIAEPFAPPDILAAALDPA